MLVCMAERRCLQIRSCSNLGWGTYSSVRQMPSSFLPPTVSSNPFLSTLPYCLLGSMTRSNLTVRSWTDPNWLLPAKVTYCKDNQLEWGSVLKSVLSCFSLAIMETEEEITDSTTHTFSTVKNDRVAESLESGWSLWPYRTPYTEAQRKTFRYIAYYETLGEKWTIIPTEINLMAIKRSLFLLHQ